MRVMWPGILIASAIAYLLLRKPTTVPMSEAEPVEGGFVHPVPGACVTSPFGMRSSGMHYGVDYGVEVGTPVYAPHGGTVYAAGWSEGCGNFLGIAWDGGSGERGPHLEFCHLDRFAVAVGDEVSMGQLVAYSGDTAYIGQTTGPHLHIEYRDGATNTYINPPWEAASPSPSCYS